MAKNLANLLVQVGVSLSGELKVEQKIKGLRRLVGRFADSADKDVSKVRMAFRRMGQAAARAGAKIRKTVQGAIKRMGGLKNVALAAAAAVVALAVATFKFVDSQTQAIDKLNKTADAIGINIGAYQRLRFAASQSGVDLEQLDKGLLKLNANLLDISKGSGKLAAEALEQIGIEFDEIQGKTREEQLGMIADGLNGVADTGERAALAARLFGARAGPQLSILLAEGSEGIAELAAQASGVFTKEDADRATEFQDRLGEVKNVVGGLVTDLALDLLPAVSDVVVGFKNWITTNREVISQGMAGVIDTIADAFKVLSTAVELTIWPLQQIASLFDDGAQSGDAFKAAIWDMVVPFRALANAIDLATEALYRLNLAKRKVAKLPIPKAVLRGAQRQALGLGPVPSEESSRAFGTRAKAKRAPGGGKGKAARKQVDLSALATGGLVPFAAGVSTGVEAGPRGPITLDEAMRSLLGGAAGDISARVKGLAGVTPATASIKPTVAIDFWNLEVTQHISGADPKEVARESTEQITRALKAVNAKAAAALASNVKR